MAKARKRRPKNQQRNKILMQRSAKSASPRTSETVTQTESFAAVVEKGRYGLNVLSIVSRAYYQNQLNKFKEGTRVTVELHTRKPKRTIQQNRYYWGVYLPLIAEQTGEKDLEALHELFKGKFLSEGIVEVLGEKVRKKKSTTALGIMEFCEYIMAIENLTQIAAPPTENYELDPLPENGRRLSTEGCL